MKILFLLRNPEGGIRTHVEALMRGALARGHECLLVTDLNQADFNFRETLKVDATFKKHIVSVPMRSAPGPWDLVSLWQIAFVLRSAGPFDIVHGHGAKGGIFARLLKILGLIPDQTKVVYTPHGGSLHAMFGGVMNRVYPLVERVMANATDLLLFESRYSEEQYVLRVGCDLAKSKLNRNGVPELPADLNPWPDDLGRITPIRIGAFGILRSIKGFTFLVRAAGLLRDRGLKFELDIFGEGYERPALEALIAELKLEPWVHLRGENARAIDEMKWRHIVVQPSLFESFGLVALEAQALGRAVVASRVGGLVDAVDHPNTGLLVPPSDPTAIADAIEELVRAPAATGKMRYAAVERARRLFSVTTMIDGAIAAYQELQQ